MLDPASRSSGLGNPCHRRCPVCVVRSGGTEIGALEQVRRSCSRPPLSVPSPRKGQPCATSQLRPSWVPLGGNRQVLLRFNQLCRQNGAEVRRGVAQNFCERPQRARNRTNIGATGTVFCSGVGFRGQCPARPGSASLALDPQSSAPLAKTQDCGLDNRILVQVRAP